MLFTGFEYSALRFEEFVLTRPVLFRKAGLEDHVKVGGLVRGGRGKGLGWRSGRLLLCASVWWAHCSVSSGSKGRFPVAEEPAPEASL